MSLEFAIIPTIPKFFSVAHDIKTKLTNSVNLDLDIQIDTDTDVFTKNRIQKWKKKGYNIIFLGDDYDESNSIIVTFSEKGSRPQPMEIDEFIDLISTYDPSDDDEPKTFGKTDNSLTNSDDDDKNDSCIIM
jgi:hypothetical protein